MQITVRKIHRTRGDTDGIINTSNRKAEIVMFKKFFRNSAAVITAMAVLFGIYVPPAAAADRKTTLVTYPAPAGVELLGSYSVKIRPKGGGDDEWQSIDVYKVQVMSNGVREAGMVYFDCDGPIEVQVTCNSNIDDIENGLNSDTAVYPESYGIELDYEPGGRDITLTALPNQRIVLDPNGDTRRNLQIWSGEIMQLPTVDELKAQGKTVTVVDASKGDTLEQSYNTDVVYIKPGFYDGYYNSCVFVKSNQTWYMDGGAVINGQINFNDSTNASLIGRGMVYRPVHAAYSVDDVTNLYINGVMALNYGWGDNGGYCINIANAKNVVIKNVKSIARHKWGDCMDIFCSEDVTVEGCFFRGNDDCIAIYGPRWTGQYWGETGNVRNIKVKNCVLMPDLARPIHFGTHGDSSSPNGGRVIDNCRFEDIDILTYNKYAFKADGSPMPQAIRMDVCEGNSITNIYFNDIRIRDFAANKLVELYFSTQGRYGTASIPGKAINNIYFKDVDYRNTDDTFDGRIEGWKTSDGKDGLTQNVTFENLLVNGKLAQSAADAHLNIGSNTKNIKFVKSGEAKYIYNPSIVPEDIWPEYYDYAQAAGVSVSADIASENGSAPSAAFDKDNSTVWYSAAADADPFYDRDNGNTLTGKGLLIDLGAQRHINGVRMTYADPAKEHLYRIFVSADGTDWSAGHSDEGNWPGAVNEKADRDFNRRVKWNHLANQEVPIIGRYVKIVPCNGSSLDLTSVEILGTVEP